MDQVQARIDVTNWITGFVEKPSPLLNGWPPCPYARQARLENRVDIRMGSHPYHDLEQLATQGLGDLDVVVLVYDPGQFDLLTFRKHWQSAQQHLHARGLLVLEDHPSEPEMVRGVCMNQGTWALLFVQDLKRLNDAAQQLATKGYYHNWPREYLNDLFQGRADPTQT
jgi:hypothetical protein